MDPHIHEEGPDIIEPFRVFVQLARQDLVLDHAELLLDLHQEPEVPLYKKFKKIIQESLQRRKPPSLSPGDLLNCFGGELAFFNEDNSFFVQGERQLVRRASPLRAPGHVESTRQRVKVDDRFRLQHIRGVHVHIDDHVEPVLGGGPGLRIYDGHVGRISLFSVVYLLRGARGERFFDLVVHMGFSWVCQWVAVPG